MDAEQRYKFHRMARYLLALPMVFLLDWWAASLILAVLPLVGVLRIAVFVAIFAILACAPLWYLFKRYKNFKPSKLFVKNPNLSLLLFTVENLSLGAFYGGFSAHSAARYSEQQYERPERGFCICVRALLPDRFRDFICLMKRKPNLCAFRAR